MKNTLRIGRDEVRRVRRALDQTQAEFALRLGVDPVTVARWETGQRRCAGLYAMAVARLDPQGRLPIPDATVASSPSGEEAKLTALTQLVRAFFQGSTEKAVSALVEREKLSDQDLDDLASLIRAKRRSKGGKR
jgi:transcriptional regulator with XRE-family HTH domain